MKQYEKLYYILLLCDMCATLARLTLLFEQENVDLSCVYPQVHSTIHNIEKMKRHPGPYLSKVENMAASLGIEKRNEEKVKEVRDKFIVSLTDHLEERLEHIEVVSALSVLDLSRVPANQCTFHGDIEISQLSNHLQLPEDDVLFEWNDLKEKFNPVLSSCTRKFMLEKLHETKETTGIINPLMNKLLSIHQTLILSTAPVERVFSQVKLIVTEHRNS
ncbi:uncharacterized protein LOC128559206 [Mercenaria mercenaria]|uniref:uncharacterized protein LOC128559206 n=1 Tax=Mercenaria mercenaria TaxID=6596 RepID=UPI00234F79A5|nr:uncharacterized protein LOC128559206 [Mercenaria mercenaria]